MNTPQQLLRATDSLSSLASGLVSSSSLDHRVPSTDGMKSDGTIASSSASVSPSPHEGTLIPERRELNVSPD